MAIQELTPMSAAEQQIIAFNNAAGAVERNTFSLPTDTAFAVFGTLVADGMVVGDVPTMEGLFEALDEITNAEPLQWGQAPAEILIDSGEATHETQLAIDVLFSQVVGFGGDKGQNENRNLTPRQLIKPPLGKKLIIWGAVVRDYLDQDRIVELETAVEGVTGVTSFHLLVKGETDAELVGAAAVAVTAQLRIKRIPEEP